jgi:transposase
LELSEAEQAELTAAARREPRVRHWRRYQAILLIGSGASAQAVAWQVGCNVNSITRWVAAWRAKGLVGLQEAPHQGRQRVLRGAGDALLKERLGSDPQQHGYHTTGWTAVLLQGELAQVGQAVSERTVRRSLHGLGWCWKRPKYVLGRRDPAYLEKKPL